MNQNLIFALNYANAGIPVIPVVGKHPIIDDWPNLATTDIATIKQWFDGRPDLNVGIVTGKRSGFVVLDIDPRHGGNESLARIEEKFGRLPVTASVRTGGGGRHLYFRAEGETGIVLKNAVEVDGYEGVDVRADGGYVVAPPSVHENGKTYEWETNNEQNNG